MINPDGSINIFNLILQKIKKNVNLGVYRGHWRVDT
jgi:hypothetical protein